MVDQMSNQGFGLIQRAGTILWTEQSLSWSGGTEPVTSTCTITLADGSYRMYFTGPGGILTFTSTGNGMTWTREGEITLSGSYGGQTNDPDIIQLSDGSYRLFFTTPPEGTSIGDLRLRSAVFTDGRTFTVETGDIQTPSGSITSILDPDTILITGTSNYRCYYGTEPAGDLHAIISP